VVKLHINAYIVYIARIVSEIYSVGLFIEV